VGRWWRVAPNDGIKAIFVQFFDGTSYTAGSIPASGFTKSEFTFEQGETLQGQYILCGNGIGTRTGYIYFETSKGRTFQVGEEHTDYIFDSGNSFLMGLFGQSGSDIDQLGFYLMKHLQSVALTSVDYTNLGSLSTETHQGLYTFQYCNSDKSLLTETFSFMKQTGQKYTFTTDDSFSFGLTFSVDAGLPEGPSVSASTSWTVSQTETRAQTVDSHSQFQYSTKKNILARSFGRLVWTWWNNQVTLKYIGTMVYTFKDGSIWEQFVTGNYQGVHISESSYYIVGNPICPGAVCVGNGNITSCACVEPKKKCTTSSDCCKHTKKRGCTIKGACGKCGGKHSKCQKSGDCCAGLKCQKRNKCK